MRVHVVQRYQPDTNQVSSGRGPGVVGGSKVRPRPPFRSWPRRSVTWLEERRRARPGGSVLGERAKGTGRRGGTRRRGVLLLEPDQDSHSLRGGWGGCAARPRGGALQIWKSMAESGRSGKLAPSSPNAALVASSDIAEIRNRFERLCFYLFSPPPILFFF